MKRIFWIAVALVGLIAIAACQKQAPAVPQPESEEAVAVLSVKIPEEIATKVYSDGTSATKLQYAVYRNDEFLFGNQEDIQISLQTTVDIRLVKNVAYDIVFWAQHPDAPYTFDKAAKTITVSYDNADANDETRDAFFQLVEDYVYVPSATVVELYRPFAQINFGASDYKDVTALALDMTSSAEISGLPNVLNVLDRTVSGSADVNFKHTAVPAASGEKLSINGDDQTYAYVSMNYVLAPAENSILGSVTGRFFYNNAEVAVSAANVPYKRNYRTNIIGQFYTGEAKFNIEIVPIFNNPDYIL